MAKHLALTCLLLCAGCSTRSAPIATPGPDAAATAPRAQPAPETDPELLRAAALHEPCAAAEEGVRKADASLDARPDLAPLLYRLGQWLQLRDAHCFQAVAPARHAASPAQAFAAAMKLDPTRAEYVLSFATEQPEDPEAVRAVDALLQRDPGSGLARLLKARRPGTKLEEAIALLSDPSARCASGAQLELGERYLGKREFALARDAYRRELAQPCESLGIQWAGEALSRTAAARLGLATAALELGEDLLARRQLAWLHFDAVDAALPLVDPETEETLWKRLGERGRPPKAEGLAATPEEAIRRLEEAALRADSAAVAKLLVDEKDLDRAFPGCAEYAEDSGTYPLCLLRELLPEEPRVEGCEARAAGAICRVAGFRESEPWAVYLLRAGKGWRVAATKKP